MSGEEIPPPAASRAKRNADRPQPGRMRSTEFEIVRDLMAGRMPQPSESRPHGRALAPAPFREIDGEVLARQYVAYRKFIETEAQERAATGEDGAVSGGHVPQLHGERRSGPGEEQASGWLAGLTRLWRR